MKSLKGGLALASLFASSFVHGNLVPPAGLFDFNLFVLDNATVMNGDVEGTTAVGGNTSSLNWNWAQTAPLGPTDAALVGGGNVSLTNTGVQRGSIYYGGTFGSVSSGFNHPGGGAGAIFAHPSPVDFAAAETYLTSLTAFLATQPQTGGVTVTNNFGNIFIENLQSGINFVNLTPAQLSSTELRFFGASDAYVVVNVAGTDLTITNGGQFFNGNDLKSTGFNGRVLYNFSGAEFVRTASVGGSILAPDATHLGLWAGGVIWGQVYVEEVNLSTQYNWAPFHWDPIIVIPEPASIGAFAGLLLGGLVLLRRRWTLRA